MVTSATNDLRLSLMASCCLSLFLLTEAVTSPARAQEAAQQSPDQSTGLEEIVVTAQKRSENVQTVPIAITAISARALQSEGINTVDDLTQVTPGLNVQFGSTAPVIFMRGVGNNAITPGQEQNVGVYVDGVYYASVVSDVFSFNDIDHIEVLKGPQGTLFGRNTTGGLVQVITKDPSNIFGGHVSAGYGNYSTVQSDAYVTGGLTEDLAADLSISMQRQEDGWGKNLFDGQDDHRRYDLEARSKWVYQPTEGTKVTLSANYVHVITDLGAARTVLPGVPVLPAALGFGHFDGNIYDTDANFPSVVNVYQYGASLRWDQDLGFAKLVNIFAGENVVNHTDVDLDATSANFQSARYSPDHTQTFSEELQLLSPDSSPIKWIVGLYYFNELAGAGPLNIFGDALGPLKYENILASLGTNSYSIFGQATVPVLGDDTHLTLGMRYTIDEKSVSGRITTALNQLAAVDDSKNWETPTYRLALDHRLADDLLGYISVSSGFKSGVYNANSPQSPPVNPEKLWDYEIGLKSELFNKHLRLNLSGFYYDYRNIQLTRFVGSSTVLQNAAQAEIYGLEVEGDALVTEQLSLRAGLSLLHSAYTSYPNAVINVRTASGIDKSVIGDDTGKELQRTPSVEFMGGLDYSVPISYGELGFNLSYYYNGGFAWEPDNRLRQGAYQLVNTELSWSSPDDMYRLRLWVKNLAGEKYFSYVVSSNGGPDEGMPGAPRTFGFTAEYKF